MKWKLQNSGIPLYTDIHRLPHAAAVKENLYFYGTTVWTHGASLTNRFAFVASLDTVSESFGGHIAKIK